MEFKGLESLLQKSFSNKDLQVIDYTATKLLPAGENYGSIMVKIDAKIRKNENAKEEVLHLVAKTPSRPEKSIIEWPLIFKKECFMYTELFPLYRELEKESCIDEKDWINVLPNFVGYRNSLPDCGKSDDEVDENSAILMENLKIKGYYLVDKKIGIDVHHARKALTSLARYHALGIVMMQKRPSFAKKAIQQAQTIGVDFSQLDIAYIGVCEILANYPRLKKHSAVIYSSLEHVKDGGLYKAQPTQPWATITHGDFWTNNMLFHKNNGGLVDDVKFVDFQTYLYSNPLLDVCLFLGSSLDMEAQANHLEELLNMYYDVFIKTLEQMGLSILPFTKESFDCEVKKQAINEFLHCALAFKFFFSEIIDDNKSNEENVQNIVNDKPSDVFIERIIWLAEVYERMKWF